MVLIKAYQTDELYDMIFYTIVVQYSCCVVSFFFLSFSSWRTVIFPPNVPWFGNFFFFLSFPFFLIYIFFISVLCFVFSVDFAHE